MQRRNQSASSSEAGTEKPTVRPDSSSAPDLLLGCRANFIYEVREPAVGGKANVFVGVTDWDGSSEACWSSLSEYYNNIAPDSGVTLQKAYFIAEPTGKAVNQVSRWSQMTEEVKNRVIGVSVYHDYAETMSFTEGPFSKGTRKTAVAKTLLRVN